MTSKRAHSIASLIYAVLFSVVVMNRMVTNTSTFAQQPAQSDPAVDDNVFNLSAAPR
jgi:hypothetical protein